MIDLGKGLHSSAEIIDYDYRHVLHNIFANIVNRIICIHIYIYVYIDIYMCAIIYRALNVGENFIAHRAAEVLESISPEVNNAELTGMTGMTWSPIPIGSPCMEY